MPKMVSIKRDRADDDGPMPAPAYPYGMSLRLDKELIEKLGIKGLPALDKEVEIVAKAKVTSRSESSPDGGYESAYLELQITDLGVDTATTESEKADRMWPQKKG